MSTQSNDYKSTASWVKTDTFWQAASLNEQQPVIQTLKNCTWWCLLLRPHHSPPISLQSSWPNGFHIMTTEMVHSPYWHSWTIWHVSIRDQCSYSNDFCCGSLSQLMTSATADKNVCLAVCVGQSICLSATFLRLFYVHADNNSTCIYKRIIYLSMHGWKTVIQH